MTMFLIVFINSKIMNSSVMHFRGMATVVFEGTGPLCHGSQVRKQAAASTGESCSYNRTPWRELQISCGRSL